MSNLGNRYNHTSRYQTEKYLSAWPKHHRTKRQELGMSSLYNGNQKQVIQALTLYSQVSQLTGLSGGTGIYGLSTNFTSVMLTLLAAVFSFLFIVIGGALGGMFQ